MLTRTTNLSILIISSMVTFQTYAQDPGTPAATPAPTATTPPSTNSGGVAVEYEKDYGAGSGAIEDSDAQAEAFLVTKGWSKGPNPNGMIVVVGKASMPCGSDDKNFDQCRRQAYLEAMLQAKKKLVQFMAVEVETDMASTYAEGQLLKKPDPSLIPKPEVGMLEKVGMLLNNELDKRLKTEGIEPGATPEQKKAYEDAKQKAAKETLSSSTFRSAVKAIAKHQISSIQAYRTFESIAKGANGSIAVIAIYSNKSSELQRALLGQCPPPKGAPTDPIATWARAQGAGTLLYTHGAQPRTNEKGEVVLVAFGQSTPIGKTEKQFDAAQKKATLNAMASARRYLGEVVASEEEDIEASTLKEFADDSKEFESESQYSESIKAKSDSLKMPGGLEVYTWKFQHPQSDRPTAGCVMVYSVSEALKANGLRDKFNKAGGAAGGAGISGNREAPSTEKDSSKKVPSGKGSEGKGSEGEAP